MGWWAISGEALMELLNRVAQGEDPGLVYTEAYANSLVDSDPDPESDEDP